MAVNAQGQPTPCTCFSVTQPARLLTGLVVGFLLQIYGTKVWAMIVQSYANAGRARTGYNLSLQFYASLPSIAEHLAMHQSHEDSSLVIVTSSWNSY